MLSELVPPGYNILQHSQSDKCCSSVLFLAQEWLGVNEIHSTKDDHDTFTKFEHMECLVDTGKSQLRLYYPIL